MGDIKVAKEGSGGKIFAPQDILMDRGRDFVRMTFAEIEEVLNLRLPPSKQYPAWHPTCQHLSTTIRWPEFSSPRRERDLTIVTRDRAILTYGSAGHVRTLAC